MGKSAQLFFFHLEFYGVTKYITAICHVQRWTYTAYLEDSQNLT